MSHDQRYKDLLRAFFHDFLTLFLPAIAAGVDPGAITFVDTQTFTSQPEGNLRQADRRGPAHPSDWPTKEGVAA